MAAAFHRAWAVGLLAWMRVTCAPALRRRRSRAPRRMASVNRLFCAVTALLVPPPMSVPRLRRASRRGKAYWGQRRARSAASGVEEAM